MTLIEPNAEAYALDHTTPFAGALAAAAEWTARESTSPGMMAGLAEARLLQALVTLSGARSVLEIGTFTGVGALALASALPEGGHLTSLEVDPERAEVARRHIAAGGFSDRVEVIVGDAEQTLPSLPGPFDLVWIDALKSAYPAYLDAIKPKLSARGVIAADNVLRAGAVLDPGNRDAGTVAIREFNDRVQADADLDNVLLTIGDGVLLAWRRP